MNRLKPQQQRKKIIANPTLIIIGVLFMAASEVIYRINEDMVVASTLLLIAALGLVVASLIHKKEKH